MSRAPSAPASLATLLDETPQAAYWIGFIFADGTILRERRLRIKLAAKDAGHLRSFAAWVGVGEARESVEAGHPKVVWDRQEPESVRALIERFDLRPHKTRNPPQRLPYGAGTTLLRSFLVGLIDGDGHIRRQTGRSASYIHTVAHPSWLPFLSQLSVATGFGTVGTRATGYASLRSARHNENVELKRQAVELALPVLERKWERIDVSYVSRGAMKDRVLDALRAGGKTQARIAAELGCQPSYVSQLSTKRSRGLFD